MPRAAMATIVATRRCRRCMFGSRAGVSAMLHRTFEDAGAEAHDRHGPEDDDQQADGPADRDVALAPGLLLLGRQANAVVLRVLLGHGHDPQAAMRRTDRMAFSITITPNSRKRYRIE